MTEQGGVVSGMDPTELWRKWYETSTSAWSEMTRATGDNPMDPYGVYGKWFDNLRDMQESMGVSMSTSGDGASVQNLWQRWYEMTAAGMQKGTEMSQNAVEILPRWMQMLEQARDNLLSAGTPAADPLQFATQWYNATSGPFSQFVGDLIEREEFLEPSSQFLQSYAGFYKIFKNNSEEYLNNLQLPARSDVTHIAGLVVALEDKVDNIEEMLEDLGDSTAATAAIEAPEAATPASVKALDKKVDNVEKLVKDLGDTAPPEAATPKSVQDLEKKVDNVEAMLKDLSGATTPEAATPESVQALESRLDGVEDKLDRVLAALENAPRNGGAPTAETEPVEAEPVEAEANGAATEEIDATDAAQRKATEMGIDLSTVTGTGNEGRITVDDVRKKGDS